MSAVTAIASTNKRTAWLVLDWQTWSCELACCQFVISCARDLILTLLCGWQNIKIQFSTHMTQVPDKFPICQDKLITMGKLYQSGRNTLWSFRDGWHLCLCLKNHGKINPFSRNTVWPFGGSQLAPLSVWQYMWGTVFTTTTLSVYWNGQQPPTPTSAPNCRVNVLTHKPKPSPPTSEDSSPCFETNLLWNTELVHGFHFKFTLVVTGHFMDQVTAPLNTQLEHFYNAPIWTRFRHCFKAFFN